MNSWIEYFCKIFPEFSCYSLSTENKKNVWVIKSHNLIILCLSDIQWTLIMNQIIVLSLFLVCLLIQPLSSAADISDTITSIKDRAESFINDPTSSLTSFKDKAEGFFNDQLGIDSIDFDQWYSTASEESQNAYGKIQGLIEEGKAKVSMNNLLLPRQWIYQSVYYF